jgi:hypothetical protein
MEADELISRLKRLLNIEDDLGFLRKLTIRELETLIAHIRDRVENSPKR